MSFQAYLDTIQTRTGKTPEDFMALADARGFIEAGRLKPDVKAGQVLDWLKADYDLGHGHAMSMVAWFKGKRD